ncbi:MAG TPA: acyltransferase [Fimbriimonas sp.]|nr:acyltransferase [Fimbriimonas sp.]
MRRFWRRLARKYADLFTVWTIKGEPGLTLGRDLTVFGRPVIRTEPDSLIRVGDRVALVSRVSDTQLGVNHPVVLRTLNPGAEIVIGDDTGISGAAICSAASIVIGKRCLLGANVLIVDTDFHTIDKVPRRYTDTYDPKTVTKPVIIEDDVFIGTGAIVLRGVTIGRGSVIGAGSVVTKSIPPMSVAVGNPAKVMRQVKTD